MNATEMYEWSKRGVGPGWWPVIKDLCDSIAGHIEMNPHLFEDESPFRPMQVKEKFGGLRFYATHETGFIGNFIAIAEWRAERTCETCGRPGKLDNQQWWVKTRCRRHRWKVWLGSRIRRAMPKRLAHWWYYSRWKQGG